MIQLGCELWCSGTFQGINQSLQIGTSQMYMYLVGVFGPFHDSRSTFFNCDVHRECKVRS